MTAHDAAGKADKDGKTDSPDRVDETELGTGAAAPVPVSSERGPGDERAQTWRDGESASDRLATRIERDIEAPLPWRSIAKKSVLVVVAGITIYLVFPSLAEVFSSFPSSPSSTSSGSVRRGAAGSALHLHHRAPADRVADQGMVLGGHVPTGGQRDQPDRPRRRGVRRGDAVPDARRSGQRLGDRGSPD